MRRKARLVILDISLLSAKIGFGRSMRHRTGESLEPMNLRGQFLACGRRTQCNLIPSVDNSNTFMTIQQRNALALVF